MLGIGDILPEFEVTGVKPGFMKHNGGLLFKTISEREYQFKTIIKENHLNAAGITHGGFIAAVVDAGAGTAAHRAAGNGRGALMTDPPSEGLERRTTTPMRAGSVVAFNNYTYHYGGPNITEKRRPAFVAQFRPKKMIQACRVLFGL